MGGTTAGLRWARTDEATGDADNDKEKLDLDAASSAFTSEGGHPPQGNQNNAPPA